MADSIKIPIDADTSKGIAGVQTMRKEVEKTTEAGEKLGTKTTAGLKEMGGEALHTAASLAGVSLSLAGVAAVARQMLQIQEEINAAQARAIQTQQALALERDKARVSPEAQRVRSELGIGLDDQAKMARDWAVKTGQKAEDWRQTALEAGRGQMGEMQAFGMFATATGIRAENVPDALELGFGAETPEARRAAMGRIAGVVKAGGIENTDQVAQLLQDFGAKLRRYGDPLTIIAAASKRYGAKNMRAVVAEIAENGWSEREDAKFRQFKREAADAAAGGTWGDVEAGFKGYMGERAASHVAGAEAAAAGGHEAASSRGKLSERFGLEMDALQAAGGKGFYEDVENLTQDRGMSRDLAIRYERLLRLTHAYYKRRGYRGWESGSKAYEGYQRAHSGWTTTEADVNALESGLLHEVEDLNMKSGIDTGPSPSPTPIGVPVSMGGRGVSINNPGVVYLQTPGKLADNDSTRLKDK